MYYMILNSINETLSNGHACSRTPHKQGSLVFPPRCSGVRRVAQRELKLCLRTSRIKNILV